MRVSSIGWFFDTMERTREVARWSAEAYYDIPEELIFKCGYYTTKDMFSVFRRFDKLRIGRVDKQNLLRFKKAQESDFKNAVKELTAGCKRSHWMWYVFPQLEGLGLSDMSNFYGISGIAEAQAYLDDGLLGSRYRKLARLLLGLESDNAEEIFGQIDAIKLKSSMTLFDAVDPDNMLFNAVLNKFFNGERDRKTLELLKQ